MISPDPQAEVNIHVPQELQHHSIALGDKILRRLIVRFPDRSEKLDFQNCSFRACDRQFESRHCQPQTVLGRGLGTDSR